MRTILTSSSSRSSSSRQKSVSSSNMHWRPTFGEFAVFALLLLGLPLAVYATQREVRVKQKAAAGEVFVRNGTFEEGSTEYLKTANCVVHDVINPTTDTSIVKGSTTAKATVPSLTISTNTTTTAKALLKFNVGAIPANATITQARIRLYPRSRTTAAPVSVTAYRVLKPWDKNALWTKATSTTVWAAPGLKAGVDYYALTSVTGTTTTNGKILDLNVIPLVKQMLAAQNKEFVLQSSGAVNTIQFDSVEGRVAPSLELTYSYPFPAGGNDAYCLVKGTIANQWHYDKYTAREPVSALFLNIPAESPHTGMVQEVYSAQEHVGIAQENIQLPRFANAGSSQTPVKYLVEAEILTDAGSAEVLFSSAEKVWRASTTKNHEWEKVSFEVSSACTTNCTDVINGRLLVKTLTAPTIFWVDNVKITKMPDDSGQVPVIASFSKSGNINQGERVTFNVGLSSGSGPFTYDWQIKEDGSQNFVSFATHTSNELSDTFILTEEQTLVYLDWAQIRVVVRNAAAPNGVISGEMTIVIYHTPWVSEGLSFFSTPTYSLEEGESKEFEIYLTHVRPDADGLIFYDWQVKKPRTDTFVSQAIHKLPGDTKDTFSFGPMTVADSGSQLRVVVSHQDHMPISTYTSPSVMIRVTAPLTLNTQESFSRDSTVALYRDKPVDLKVVLSQATSPIRYRWQIRDVSTTTPGPYLTIIDVPSTQSLTNTYSLTGADGLEKYEIRVLITDAYHSLDEQGIIAGPVRFTLAN